MDEMERLRAELAGANQEVAQLQQRLAQAEQQIRLYADRLTLNDQERAILAGRSDGCARIGELRPLLRRLLGDAA